MNETRYVQLAMLETKRIRGDARVRVALALTLCAALGACSVAPGQHMATPPTLPVTTSENGSVTSTQQIPIVPIDLTLIQRLRAPRVNANDAAGDHELSGKPGPYKIGPGDILQIVVWDHPELAAAAGQQVQVAKSADPASGFVVNSEGNVTFPYATQIHAAGKTADQVQNELRAKLSGTFQDPEVTVRVASYRASQIYVDGAVRSTGAQAINDIPMTLTEAINRAGGFGPDADRSHVIITRNGKSHALDITHMIARGNNPANIMLKPGDVLRVGTRGENAAFVMGEVNRPTAVLPDQDGHLTLGEALNQAGFISATTSDAKQLYVIRQTGVTPEIYHLDASSPVSMLLANQFDLQSKDVVYVDNSGLVRFNRVLSLLLPAINAGLTGGIVAK
ncbi:polysaccharide biosynthesis/export family protein [Burkholderia ubonensis]|nr:polysaccharide biosynthesis/export family protein [Burkholderia ubonensis]